MGYGARGLLSASQFYGPWGSRHFLRKWPSQRICNTLVWRNCSFWSTSRSLCFYHDVQIWCLLSTIVPINEESNLHHIHHDRKFNTQWCCLLSISLVRFCEEYWWSQQCFSKEKTRWCGPMLLTKKANGHGSRLMMAGLVGCRNNALCMVESRFRSTSQSWRSFAFWAIPKNLHHCRSASVGLPWELREKRNWSWS
jgi:hypothetical protein